MAINDVVSRGLLSHKRRETTRGGRVPQNMEKRDDVVYGWSLIRATAYFFWQLKMKNNTHVDKNHSLEVCIT